MICLDCRRAITQAGARKATTVMVDGKVVGMVHKKCNHIKAKRAATEARTGKPVGDVYESAKVRRNRTDLTAEEKAARDSLAQRRESSEETATVEEDWRDWRSDT